jgi:hypothetical protein
VGVVMNDFLLILFAVGVFAFAIAYSLSWIQRAKDKE